MSKLQELKEELEEEKDLAGKVAVCSRYRKKTCSVIIFPGNIKASGFS